MGTPLVILSCPFRTGNLGMFSWSDQRSRRFDVVALGMAMCLLLPSVGCEEKKAAPPPSPPEVEVTSVVQRDVPIYQEWVAQLNGQVNADITPKVQGYLLTRNYSEGFFVHKGQLLYEIDPRPFVASLDQAKAQVAVAVAHRKHRSAENNVTRGSATLAAPERNSAKATGHPTIQPWRRRRLRSMPQRRTWSRPS